MDTGLGRGLRLLEQLALSDRPLGVSELALSLGLGKSTVHRQLGTLVAMGFASQVPVSGAYVLTTRIWELGSHVIGRMDLVKLARPAMLRLSERTGATVHLAILHDTDIIYIDKIDGAHPLRAHTRVGARAPAWAVATGKAILAHLPPERLEDFRDILRPFTPATRLSLDALQADFARVRAQGCCVIERSEWRQGVVSCAAVLLGRRGEPVAAIGISGPDTRFSPADLLRAAEPVQEAARVISAALGYQSGGIEPAGIAAF